MSEQQADIVERLRADAKIQFIVRASLEDTADEIERLRAALKYVAGLPSAARRHGRPRRAEGCKPCREILSWCRLASKGSLQSVQRGNRQA
jgi:hypothetical protein